MVFHRAAIIDAVIRLGLSDRLQKLVQGHDPIEVLAPHSFTESRLLESLGYSRPFKAELRTAYDL
jgi:hypothetical protein